MDILQTKRTRLTTLTTVHPRPHTKKKKKGIYIVSSRAPFFKEERRTWNPITFVGSIKQYSYDKSSKGAAVPVPAGRKGL
ncbi:hypothetical protein OUZ56_006649 [Daphnia magna]|uniref:Uncharacterized protein n=1 Tax=Daphnia magna TaxID=35525 RepID=A0ABQ9YWB6_9CRUS|nr:hypothetical protein OUZ56_006649 [Daphnia magna]